MNLKELISKIDTLLNTTAYSDSSLNGLQVEALNASNIQKVAFAVDSGLEIIQEAVSHNSQLLIVHHGLFWGNSPTPITDTLAKKITVLIEGKCSLYCSHLPLDGHLEYGHAAMIAKIINLNKIAPFAPIGNNCYVGVKGILANALSLTDSIDFLKSKIAFPQHKLLPFGEPTISKIGIVTGSGTFAIELAKKEGLDLLITGEPKLSAYHTAKDIKMNLLFIGHYWSERFGLLALKEYLEQSYNIEGLFIEHLTGI